MFYRYISENLTNYINQGEFESGNTDFDYAKMPDDEAMQAKDGLVEEKGFFILPSELFCNIQKKAVNETEWVGENLNVVLEKVFSDIEGSAKGSESESDFKGLFDDFNVNSNKLGSYLIQNTAAISVNLKCLQGRRLKLVLMSRRCDMPTISKKELEENTVSCVKI